MMLAAGCHLGTKNCDFQMDGYVWKRRRDGIYIINLGKTWDKLMLAARILVAIENPSDVVCSPPAPTASARCSSTPSTPAPRRSPAAHSGYLHQPDPGGLPRAPRARAHRPQDRSPAHLRDRVREPPHHRVLRHRLPAQARRRRHPRQQQGQALHRLPLLPPRAHGAQMRGTVSPANPWDVMVDLFFYRDPEELEDKPAEEETAVVGDTPAGFDASGFGAPVAAGAAEPWDEQPAPRTRAASAALPSRASGTRLPPPAAGTPPRRPWTLPASDRASTSLPAATKRRGCDHGSG